MMKLGKFLIFKFFCPKGWGYSTKTPRKEHTMKSIQERIFDYLKENPKADYDQITKDFELI